MNSGRSSEAGSRRRYRLPAKSENARIARSATLRDILKIGDRLRAQFHRLMPNAEVARSSGARPHSLANWEREVLEEARPYTMTSPERLLATMDAVSYAVQRDVPGALVECGVWKGGSVLAMIRVLQNMAVNNRDVYLLDTFEGMTAPSEQDTSRFDVPAMETWSSSKASGKLPWQWLFDPDVFNFESVRSLILATGYPANRIHFVKGRVEETIPGESPGSIAVLRLDTDWYNSTWHELIHLYPRISEAGVLIIDDFGHWEGCRAAVVRYFSEVDRPIFLSRIDYTGRIGIKVST